MSLTAVLVPCKIGMANPWRPMRMVLDILGQIFRTLWAHKLRSFLTMFGIAWGVGSLLLLVGLGEGFRSGNKRGMNEYGENIMFLFPGRAPAVEGNMNSARYYRLRTRITLTSAAKRRISWQ